MPQPRPIRPFCEPPAIPRDQAEREELRRHVDRREEPTERAKPRPHKENPAPSVVGLVEIVREAWPQTPCLEGRVRELAETRGLREAGFAIEYARLKKASGLEYAFKMAHHWYRSGYDLGDIALEVAGARPKAKRDPLETMQNYNPPQSRASDCPPTREEIAACLGDIRSATLPAVRNCYLGILRKWARQGHVEGGLLDEFERPAGGKKPAAGPVGKLPPQSAQVPSPVSQTILRQGEKVQRARLDSNQQPSDSKSAPPPAFPSSKVTIRSAHSPNHPPIRDATAPPPGGCQPDNPTARGADPVSATPVMRIDTIRTSRTPR